MRKRSATRVRFTAALLNSIPAGDTVYDERVPNLAVRVTPKGKRTFFVLCKAGERATIGKFP